MKFDRREFMSTVALAGAATLCASARQPAQQGPRHGPKVGFVLSSEQYPIDQLVRYAAAAENAGFDAAWSSDHLQPWQPNEGHSSLAWCTLAAATQRAPRLLLGTGVTCPTYRYQPAVVAEAFASLSHLSPGRIFLGLGTGEALNEAASGVGFGKYAERHDRLIEAIQIIRKLWTGQTMSFNGQYFKIPRLRLYDPPAKPVPIYVAGNGPKSARLAGQYGDGWVTTLEEIDRLRPAFLEGVKASGRKASDLAIVMESFVVVGGKAEAQAGAEKWRFIKKSWKHNYVDNPDPADIQHHAEREIELTSVHEKWPVSLDPHVHADAIQKMAAAGATHVFVHSPQPDQVAVIDFYGKRVLPLVREARARS